MKIIINSCFGGFSLSQTAVRRYNQLKGRPCFIFDHNFSPLLEGQQPSIGLFYAFDVPEVPTERSNKWYKEHCVSVGADQRTDPMLIQVVEELGKAANGSYADLRVIEIPDAVEWEINDYDGSETVHEKHRSWS